MQTHLSENSAVYDSSVGEFISSKHQNLAQVLNEYNPHFTLLFIPQANRDSSDSKPYAIQDSSPGHAPYIMRYLSEHDMQNPAEILAWIFNGDQSKHSTSDIFKRLENERVARDLLELKAREEALEDQIEFGAYVFGERSPHTFRHNGQTYRK